MQRIFLAGLLFLCASGVARAETYYIAGDGKTENDGSRDKPWPSVEFALGKVGGGHTIVFRSGVYRGPIHILKKYGGTEKSPTVLRSEEKWKAVVVGSPQACFSTQDDCHWLTVEGFEVLGARSGGVRLFGEHNTVRNCWIHHNTRSGIGMGRTGAVIENNLVEFNGCHVQFDHGMYISGDRQVIRGNIVRHNAGFGLHLYDSLSNSVIENNLVYGQSQLPAVIVSCPAGGGHNRIVNNTFVGNGAALVAWNGDGEVVVNNILVGTVDPLGFDQRTKNVKTDYNLCLPKSQHDGPHGISANPAFLSPGQGLFWLQKGSPAISKGSPEYSVRPTSGAGPHPRTNRRTWVRSRSSRHWSIRPPAPAGTSAGRTVTLPNTNPSRKPTTCPTCGPSPRPPTPPQPNRNVTGDRRWGRYDTTVDHVLAMPFDDPSMDDGHQGDALPSG
jgi:parallel beta-helix repeat protein